MVIAGLAIIAVGLIGGGALGVLLGKPVASAHGARQVRLAQTPVPSPLATTPALEQVAGRDLPSIVTVVAVGSQSEELGTGWPVNAQGDFITNDHVVHDGLSFHVVTASGEEFPARVINSDPSLDLAEVQVAGLYESPFPIASSPATVGEPVVVLAAQSATGHQPVTTSLVDGLHQRATVGDAQRGELSNYSDLIRIPAHIYPGNSGGPMLTTQGQVVGILTLAAVNGVGAFAIPLAEVGPVIQGWLRP